MDNLCELVSTPKRGIIESIFEEPDISSVYSSFLGELVRPLGFTVPQLLILSLLFEQEAGNIPRAEIGKLAEMTKITTIYALKGLKESGHISVKIGGGNRTKKNISLTEKGCIAAKKLISILDLFHAGIAAGLSRRKLEMAEKVLSKIKLNLVRA